MKNPLLTQNQPVSKHAMDHEIDFPVSFLYGLV